MSVAMQIDEVGELLTNLIGREITAGPTDSVDPHPATIRGLVTNENQLVAVIGSDLDFAHRTSAALAMIPAGRCDDAGDTPDDDLLDVYREVSNVLSRLIDEATPMRVRLDPGMDHDLDAMQAIVAAGSPMALCEAQVDGYGSGRFGVWYQG
ncbi:MAG: hypothetical protein AAGA93_14875 [Actinomycetota bacterium]